MKKVFNPNNVNIRKLVVNLGNTYVRLAQRHRQQIMQAFEQFAFGQADVAMYFDLWSKEDMKSCYQVLKTISPKMADDFRRWASKLLKSEHNTKLALKCLMDELTVRTWIEEP